MQSHDELVELVFNLPHFAEIDFDTIDTMPDTKLREILNIPEPIAQVTPIRKNKRGRLPKIKIRKPEMVDCVFIEKNGQLHKRETWRRYFVDSRWSDDTFDIPCGARVMWEGRTVSAGLVLHWLRTGEKLIRLGKERRPYRARVRGEGGALVHLGYFATAEERDSAVLSFKLSNPLGDK